MTDTETKLARALPCPFCGSQASYKRGHLSKLHYVSCNDDNCATCGPNGKNRDSAVVAWNRYADSVGAQPASVADGWVMVPRIATAKMLGAARHVSWSRHQDIWQAMLAAAPQPPAKGKE